MTQFSIKEGKTSETHHNISLDIFKEHFEKLALGNERGDAYETSDELNNIPPNEILNRPFTPREIVEVISKLKNHKTGGSDLIINEFLKHSRHEFSTYLQLTSRGKFNNMVKLTNMFSHRTHNTATS